MRRSIFLLALLPALAWAQVLSRPGVPASGGTFTGAVMFTEPITTPGVTSTGLTGTRGITSTALLTPVNGTFTATTGTLNNGSYCYRVTARNAAGETVPSTETCLTVSGGASSNGVIVTWGAVVGAADYVVEGRTTVNELDMAVVTAPAVTWTDNGSVTPSGAMPTEGTSASITTPSRLIAKRIDTTAVSGEVALSGVNGAKFCPGTDTGACLTSDGTNITTGGNFYAGNNLIATNSIATGGLIYETGAGLPLDFRGSATDGATAVSTHIFSINTLVDPRAKILSLAPDIVPTEKAAFYVDGSMWLAPHAVGTCGDAANPEGKIVIVPGATTVPTKMCICTYTPTGAVYAWVNTLTNNAGTGIGTTTTCP